MSTQVATKRHVLIRAVGWTAWLPSYPDKNDDKLMLERGVTGLELAPGERLMDIDMFRLPHSIMAVSPDAPEGEGIDEDELTPHQLIAFNAIVVSHVPDGADPADLLSPQPDPEDSQESIAADRRKATIAQPGPVPRGVRGGSNGRGKTR